ncbi:MFS transporter [Sphingorhabdus contaminans]|uniref:MFS transporter n=1 Tax=Sphingorhabdus contaminans TaxID=1343899 RepID=UPI003D265C48
MNGRSPSSQAEWRAGWSYVAAAMVGMGVGAGLFQYVSSLFILPLEQGFGWSRGDISAASAIGLLGALSAPLIGRMADRWGTRLVAITALCGLSATFAVMAFMESYTTLLVCSAMIGMLAPGCTALTFSRFVNTRFDRSLGLALGVMMAGLSLSAFAVTLVLQSVLDAHGHTGGYLFLGALAIGLGAPATLLGTRGERAPRVNAGRIFTTSNAPLVALVKNRIFLLLAGAMFAVNLPASGVITQLRPMIGEKVTGNPGFYVAVYALSVLAGRILVGAALDRLESRLVAAGSAVFGAIGCLLLLQAVPGSAVPLALLMIGLLQGAEADVLSYLVTRNFARADYGTVYGLLVTVSLLGTAAGIYLFGALYDRTQSYDAALGVAISVLVVAVAIYWRLPTKATHPVPQQTVGDPA